MLFVPGLELSHRLYAEAVRPLLDEHFPGLAHSAALIGPGSEVLGFDTARSTDHDWGPRLQLFLESGDRAPAISEMLAELLPAEIAGYSTNLVPVGTRGTRRMSPATGRIQHAVVVADLRTWLRGQLGFDPWAGSARGTGWARRRRSWPRSPAAPSSMTALPWPMSGNGWPGIPTKSGVMCWPATGSG